MTALVRTKIDPTKYWEGENFQTYSFAEEIVETYDIATTVENDLMYWHNGRVWHRFGEQTIRSEVRAILRDAATREIVNEVVRNVKHLTRTRREDIFDLPPEKLVVANGVVDLTSGEFIPQHKYDMPGTQTWVDVEYDSETVPERFNDFLFEVLHPDDVSVLWELIGYCLYRGYPFQKAALFLGDGANGKSTLLNALVDFLGENNVSTVELHEFADDRFAAADLEGKLANIAADLDSDELENTGTFKELTGEDRIRAQRKYEPAFQFKNQATLLFSANQAPAADDTTYAYERRWLYFDFPHTFGEDGDKEAVPQQELLEAFREEYAGILNMAIESFSRLWDRGCFEDTVYMRETDDAHERAVNSAKPFVEDRIEPAEGAVLRKSEAYDTYTTWCDETGRTTQGKETFDRTVRGVHSPKEGKDPSDKRHKAWLDLTLSDGENATMSDSDHAEEVVDTDVTDYGSM